MPDDFWRRDVLNHIYRFARARRVSPWAVLGVAMVRVVAGIPPNVVLPPLIGARMSLNLFTAIVGPSGAGKDAAEAAARDAITWGCPVNPLCRLDAEIPVVPLGSGEGIARTFRPLGANPDEDNPVKAAIFTAPEIDTWAALSSRQGSTLTAEIRKMFTGATIGFANAGKDTRNVLKAHSYRACGIFGVQPLRSGPLLAAADGGLPQRFAWLPASDPDAPDDPPDAPQALPDPMPDWDTAEDVTYLGEQIEVSVPEIARQEIDSHRLSVLRGDPDVDPLDGHALLTRLKIAAGLMALDGRTVITDDDWKLAGVVMGVSTATREMCRRALAEQSRRTNWAKANAAADRDEIIADRKLARCREAIERALSRLGEDEHIPRHDLRRKVRADLRCYFDTAVAQLIDEGKMTEIATDQGTAYQPCTRVHGRTRPPTSENDPCTARTRVHATGEGDQAKRPEQPSPPGAPTAHTPGMTERVKLALANAEATTPPTPTWMGTAPPICAPAAAPTSSYTATTVATAPPANRNQASR